MNELVLTFDIETIPTDDKAVIDEIAANIKAPGQYSKPESIEKWLAENKESVLKEKVHDTGLDGLYGRIACIVAHAGSEFDMYLSAKSMDESAVIESFYDYIEFYEDKVNQIVFCGHNIAGFDLPFLKHRSMILGIKPPKSIMYAMNAKPWDKCIADTMLMWDAKKYVSLDKLCKAFGIEVKGDFDGSMVAETWPVNPKKVIDYCCDDVLKTVEVYKRMMFKGMK